MKETQERIEIPKGTEEWVEVTVASATEYTNSGTHSLEYALTASTPSINKGISISAEHSFLTPDALQKVFVKRSSDVNLYISPTI